LKNGDMKKKKTRTQQLVDNSNDMRYELTRDTPALMPYFERRAGELARPEDSPEIVGGEALPDDSFMVRDTLRNPNTTALDASMERTRLLQDAGALETGLDAAQSIGAKNSIEKMLAHQMAVCHEGAMRMMAEAMNGPSFNQNAESLMIKKGNLAARLMDVYQKGFDTLTRSRTAGKQTITVKQVHVSGGQNIIADKVTTRGRKGGGDKKNE
jgi:hypothetical protein